VGLTRDALAEGLRRWSAFLEHILLVMNIFIGLDSLLHDFVNIVDILSDVLAHVRVEGQLVLLELAFLFRKKSPCLLQIFVEVEAHLLLYAFF
jgi:hypothetical protein